MLILSVRSSVRVKTDRTYVFICFGIISVVQKSSVTMPADQKPTPDDSLEKVQPEADTRTIA